MGRQYLSPAQRAGNLNAQYCGLKGCDTLTGGAPSPLLKNIAAFQAAILL